MIITQHGILLIGKSGADAFLLMHLFERAVRIQLTVAAAGSPACVSDAVAKTTYQQWVGNAQTPEGIDEWPALLRGLDQTDPDYRN